MKNKYLILGAIVASSVLTASTAMAAGAPCYNQSMCTGNPNVIGGNNGYSNANNGYSNANNGMTYSETTTSTTTNKVLQSESTEKFVGVVQSVNRVSLPNQVQIQLTLSTDQGDMLVIVGPSSFIDQSKVKMQAGDKITVKGYRVKANGNDVIMAAEIEKNGNTLKLLNDNRQPVWGVTPGGAPATAPYSGQQNPYMPNSR